MNLPQKWCRCGILGEPSFIFWKFPLCNDYIPGYADSRRSDIQWNNGYLNSNFNRMKPNTGNHSELTKNESTSGIVKRKCQICVGKSDVTQKLPRPMDEIWTVICRGPKNNRILILGRKVDFQMCQSPSRNFRDWNITQILFFQQPLI